jgi:hypothetical protein
VNGSPFALRTEVKYSVPEPEQKNFSNATYDTAKQMARTFMSSQSETHIDIALHHINLGQKCHQQIAFFLHKINIKATSYSRNPRSMGRHSTTTPAEA